MKQFHVFSLALCSEKPLHVFFITKQMRLILLHIENCSRKKDKLNIYFIYITLCKIVSITVCCSGNHIQSI